MDENRGEQMSLTPTAPRGSDLKRRGLFAMGAALLGAAATKLAGPTQTVEAAAGGNFILGQANDAGTTTTKLNANVALDNTLNLSTNANDGNALVGLNTGNGGGLVGSVTGTGTALAGVSQQGIGLSGTSFAASGATPFAGVSGFSAHGFGVRGGTSATAQENGSGVLGEGGAQTGVQGTSTTGVGVIGTSIAGLAGQFNGPVVTNGNLTVNGTFTATGIKSAAVPDSSGGLVRLYCVESPESYFEDYGQGTLSGGNGTVALKPDFAATVDPSTALIFLTEIGNLGGLYVNGVANGSFAIASRSSSASGSFAYRIVAKRKDVEAPRLQRVDKVTGTSNFVTPRNVDKPAPLPATPGQR